MKNNWQTKKLGEVCDIKTGKKDVNQGNPNGKYPFFTCAREHTFSDDYSFDTEALLVAGNGDVGHVSYYNGKFEAYQRTYVLANFKDVLPRFLFLFLDGFLKETVSKQKLGNTMPYIKMGMLTEFEIPLPPLAEQKRIVKILDEVFGGIEKARENAEKNLKNSQELFESYLQGVFDSKKSKVASEKWEKKLGEVCDFVQGIQIDAKLQSETKKENQVRFLRIIDFTQGGELPRYVDNPGEKYIINTNDISLVRYGASTGFVCRGLEGVLANNLFRVIPKNIKEISNEYLFIFLKSPVFKNIIKKSLSGTAMPAISFGLVRDILIPIISLSEQKAIVKKLDALAGETKKLEAIYRKKIADLNELKKSVLKKAFSGEL